MAIYHYHPLHEGYVFNCFNIEISSSGAANVKQSQPSQPPTLAQIQQVNLSVLEKAVAVALL
jgi:hypothetical protein